MEGNESQRQFERRGARQAGRVGLPRQRQVQQDVAGHEGGRPPQLHRRGHRARAGVQELQRGLRLARRRHRRALPRAHQLRPADGGRRVLQEAVRHRGAAGVAAERSV